MAEENKVDTTAKTETERNEDWKDIDDALINGLYISETKEELESSSNMVINGSNEQKSKLFEAMAQYIGEVSNPANTKLNTFFHANYAPLDEVLNAVRPVMSKYGLSLTQSVGSEDGYIVTVTTLLTHKDGGYIYYPALKGKATKNDIQGLGATSTYLRRFALNAIANVCGEVDDDGNAASDETAKVPVKKKEPTKRQQFAAVAKQIAITNRAAVDKVVDEYSDGKGIKDIPEDKIDEATAKLKEIK